MTARPPLCIECKHYRRSSETGWAISVGTLDECSHPALTQPDFVRGTAHRPVYCSDERNIGAKCGRDGKLFQARPVSTR